MSTWMVSRRGLRAEADRLAQDHDYVEAVTCLGGRYLDDGRALLHGDFSLAVGSKPRRAFASSIPSSTSASSWRISLARQPSRIRKRVCETYVSDERFDGDLAARFTGVEIMRRLLGVAQLPLSASLAEKQQWLARSRQLVCGREPWGTIQSDD